MKTVLKQQTHKSNYDNFIKLEQHKEKLRVMPIESLAHNFGNERNYFVYLSHALRAWANNDMANIVHYANKCRLLNMPKQRQAMIMFLFAEQIIIELDERCSTDLSERLVEILPDFFDYIDALPVISGKKKS